MVTLATRPGSTHYAKKGDKLGGTSVLALKLCNLWVWGVERTGVVTGWVSFEDFH